MVRRAARPQIFCGNWKMYKTVAEAVKYVHELRAMVPDMTGVQVVLAPTFTALHPVAEPQWHQFPGAGGVDGRPYFRNAGIRLRKQQVFQHRGVEQYGVLADHAQQSAPRGYVDLA